VSLVADLNGMSLEARVERLLACPSCRSSLLVEHSEIRCTSAICHFSGRIMDGVVLVGDGASSSFFDAMHPKLTVSNEGEGVWSVCYQQQDELLQSVIKPGSLVVDVGCGPSLPYSKPKDTFFVGVEASYQSVRLNAGVDMRIYGTATSLPLPESSVDAIVSFYAVHHMTGETVAENFRNAARAFSEFRRVIKPGGELLVFEISPWTPVWLSEKMLWNRARSLLGKRLDMFFYSVRAYQALGRVTLPGAQFSVRPFRAPMTTMMPLSFSVHWLQVPRAVVPMSYNLFRWRL
jgi:SAM-dependent methyltransferase